MLSTLQGEDASSIGTGKTIHSKDVKETVDAIFDRYKMYKYNMDCFIKAISSYNWTKNALKRLVNYLLPIVDTGPEILLADFKDAISEYIASILLAFDFNQLEAAREEYIHSQMYFWEYFVIKLLEAPNRDETIKKILTDKLNSFFEKINMDNFTKRFSINQMNIVDAFLANTKHLSSFEDFVLNQLSSNQFQFFLGVLCNFEAVATKRYLLVELSQETMLTWCDTPEKARSLACLIPISEYEETTKKRSILIDEVAPNTPQIRWSKLLSQLLIRFADDQKFLDIIYQDIKYRIDNASNQGELKAAHYARAKCLFQQLLDHPKLQSWAKEKLAEVTQQEQKDKENLIKEKEKMHQIATNPHATLYSHNPFMRQGFGGKKRR